MLEDSILRFDPVAPWRGDLNARLVMELPVYNIAALALDTIPAVSFDMAGRLASLIFWVLSFIALQALWRRTLPTMATFWANFLFIFAPMNWYLSTAFMPESLLQVLAICFMIYVLDYSCKRSWGAFAGLVFTGLLGLLVKLPSFVHLGLFACLVLLNQQGWKSLFRPALLSAGLVILLCVFAWGEYVKGVNEQHFAEWAGWENVVGFIRPESSRLSLSYWLPFTGYNVAFITTFAAAPFIGAGIWRIWKSRSQSFHSQIWIYLLISLILNWLVWGKGAPAQNYYNLPNLVFFCAAFGTCVAGLHGHLISKAFKRTSCRFLGGALATSIALLGFLGYIYLSRPDRVTLAVADWVSANLPYGTTVAYQPRHALGVIDYQHQPLLSHLTSRRSWILVRTTPEAELERALSETPCIIVTHPDSSIGLLENLRRRFKGAPSVVPESLLDSQNSHFQIVATNSLFSIALRKPGN